MCTTINVVIIYILPRYWMQVMNFRILVDETWSLATRTTCRCHRFFGPLQDRFWVSIFKMLINLET